MEAFACVRHGHLNQHGRLFGGQLLLWCDEFAWIAAARDFPCCKFVTIAFDRSEFRRPAPLGAILRFVMTQERRGKTSIHYSVYIYAKGPDSTDEELIFTTLVSFVRVDDQGHKIALPQ